MKNPLSENFLSFLCAISIPAAHLVHKFVRVSSLTKTSSSSGSGSQMKLATVSWRTVVDIITRPLCRRNSACKSLSNKWRARPWREKIHETACLTRTLHLFILYWQVTAVGCTSKYKDGLLFRIHAHAAFLSLIENVNVGVAIIIVLLCNCLQYAADMKSIA